MQTKKTYSNFFIYQILGIMTNIASSAHFKEELYSFFCLQILQTRLFLKELEGDNSF